MPGYSKESLIALEKTLFGQHEVKAKRGGSGLLTAHDLSKQLRIPVGYIRRLAWEHRLDPFPGLRRHNDIQFAADLVIYHGLTIQKAGLATGFRSTSISAWLTRHGWRRYSMWGHAGTRKLVLSKPYTDARWRVQSRGKMFFIQQEDASCLK